jgi:phosphopantetheinyl transferase (holo-ACP synthase)
MAPWLAGNDVVDIGDPANAGAHERPRWLARVCAEEERRALAVSREPGALLWSFFAAKEAAFKLACKLGPRPVFAHRRFVVARTLASVRHEGRAFRLWVERVGERVHAVAWTGGDRPLAIVAKVDPAGDMSAAARRLLAASLGRRLRCSPAMLAVVRDAEPESWDDLGPPRLLRCGLPVETDVSLSHDGRFVAFAACL